jgi:DnaK suppressor protein
MAVKPLPKERLKRFEQELLLEKDETLRIISEINANQKRGSKDNSGDVSSFSLHQADQGSDTDSMEREASNLEQTTEKLRHINNALNRIHEKTYGICEICGEYIPDARLKILPYARYCISCKSREEQRKK